jgi:hypothetical protein
MVNLSDTDANNCVVDSIQFNKNSNYLALAMARAKRHGYIAILYIFC